jgi:hypothetical protein
MGQPDDKLIAEAHGWNPNRPGIKEVLAAGKKGPKLVETQGANQFVQGWFVRVDGGWAGPYTDPQEAKEHFGVEANAVYLRELAHSRIYASMGRLLDPIRGWAKPSLADLQKEPALFDLIKTFPVKVAFGMAVEELAREVETDDWGVPDQRENEAIRSREQLACALHAADFFDQRIKARALEANDERLIRRSGSLHQAHTVYDYQKRAEARRIKVVDLKDTPVTALELYLRMVCSNVVLALILEADLPAEGTA